MHDFRSYLQVLEDRDQVDHIATEVDPRYELAGVMSMVEAAGRAYHFEKVTGAKFPAVGGLYNRLEHLGSALGVAGDAPFTHQAFAALLERAKANPISAIEVATSPVKEVIKHGDDVDLAELPVPSFFERDTGPFITAAIGISRDPETGVQNVGVYRTLILDRNRIVINASSISDLRRIYRHWETTGRAMPIALAIGVAPAMLVAAACKLPPDRCEFDVAGALMGAPLELVACENSDLLVPASAEFIIEATVDPSQRVENLLGEFAGQYGPEDAPVSTVTTITHRHDAMFYSILAGRNAEHNLIGNVAAYDIQRSIAQSLTDTIPAIKRIHVFLTAALGAMAHIVIAIDKTDDAEPRQIIEQAFATQGALFPISKITKRIVVVDDDIDIEDLSDVEWAIWTRVADAEKFMVIPDVESWEMERAAKSDGSGADGSGAGGRSVRIGVDATMDLADVDKLVRPIIPGAAELRREDYLGQ